MKPKPIVRMVPRAVITLLFAVMVLAVFVPTVLMQQGGTFEIKPSVIAGGGGTSSNGSTRIDGTVGQGILGSSSGGNFTLNAGFWQSQPAGTVDIAGQVLYCAAASPPGAPNTTLTVTAGGSGMATTDSMGNYTIASLPAGGTYTVTPSKTGAVSGINTTDASRILQFIAGTFTLTSCQQLAADTSQNSVINTTDVTHILNFIAGNPPVASNHTGEWRFNPSSRTYVSVLSNQTSQNYDAMELGEVSGNWIPAGPSTPPNNQKSPVAPLVPCGAPAIPISLPNASVAVTLTNFTLPITIGNTTGESVTGYDIRFTFDPAVVGLQATPVDTTGTLSSGMSFTTNTTTPGLLIVTAAQTGPLTGSGTLLKVNFTRLGAQGTSTLLTWTRTELDDAVNDCIHPATPNNGTISINAGPTAVKLDKCVATGYDNGVYLEWKTGLEVDNLGFNVYREKAGQKELITPEMLAGSALLTGKANLKTGRTYGWWDPSKDQQGVQYWVEDIDVNGQSNWHGPVAAQFVGGSPPSQSDAAVLSGIGNSKASPNASNNVERRALARASADQPAIQFDLAGGPAAKVSVRHEGWYTLSSSQLVAGGLKQNPNPDRLQMYVDGVQVPINVITDDKKQLSAVEFYGVGLDAAYTDARVYWIVEGKENGLRIQQVNADAHPSSDRSFNYSVERRDRTVYFSSLRNGERENFFGPVVGRDAVTQSLALQHIDTSAPTQAQVEVSLQGVTALPHRVWVYANGTFVGEIPFNGQELRVASFALPISLLKEGDNEVRLAAQGGPLDVSLIDYVRLSYRHTFTAEADQLRFTATAGAAVTVDGFSSAAIRVFDVTNQDQVQQLVGKVEQQKSGYAVTVSPAEKGDRILLAIGGRIAGAPAGVSANVSSNLRSNSHAANLLIVSNRDFFPALETLKTLRTSQGYKVEIVDVEDIYDEFSFGDKSPYAVRTFLQYARTNWKTPPQYVLLAGDASYDPKNYLGFGDWDIVPTKLIDTEFMETASDDWFADFDADGVPEMAVGRLPVRSKEEAASMVGRIVSYDRSSGSAELTLVADANEGFDFESANAQLRALVPSDTRIVEIDRGRMGDQAKPALMDAINRGQKIVNYSGHGNVDQWRANLLTNADAGLLTNQNHLALFVMMTCLNGYSDDPALSSLAKALMKSASGGAVAVWASSGTTMPDEQVLMNQEFYRQLFANRGITLGNAINRAKAAVTDPDVRRTWILLGDPTMKLR